jgi:toxin HigB-1
MIKTFAQSWLEEFWHSGKHNRVPSELRARLLRKMDMLNRAAALKDLSAPPSNHLHPLQRGREGQWAISVNGPWRLCFRFESGHVFDLELIQYH